MRTRICGFILVTVFAWSGVAQAQRKCDNKKAVEGVALPACGPVLNSGGRICPVLRAPDGTLHPNIGYVWAYPNDDNNFEVRPTPGEVTRANGCLLPLSGYEWVRPSDSRDFAVRPIGTSNASAVAVRPMTAAASAAASPAQADCSPTDVPGKHGTLNNYRVPFNGDGNGNGISHSIFVAFRLFDDGRIEAPLRYENDSKAAFCGGVHVRLSDKSNNSLAEFYSDPHQCVDGRPLISLSGGPIDRIVSWSFRTSGGVACRYANLYIVPNYDHAASSPESPSASDQYPWIAKPGRWQLYELTGGMEPLRSNETFWLTAPNGRRAQLESASADAPTVAGLILTMCSQAGILCYRSGNVVAVPESTSFHVLGGVNKGGLLVK
jgi:hypothetical protein